MPQFTFKAKTASGEVKTGIIAAENNAVVSKKLKAEGLFPITISEASILSEKKSYKKVNPREVSVFTRQLSDLMRSGFTLSIAISTLKEQEQNSGLKKILGELNEAIQKGSTFFEALNRYPGTFSSFYVNMVRVGETTGKLDEALERLADFKEKEEELSSQIRSALAYPLFIFAIGIITVFVMITFFIPRISTIISGLGQSLPMPTRILIQVSRVMHSFWWLLAAAAVVIFIFARAFYKNEKNRLMVDGLILRLPLVKTLIQKVEITRLTYSLAVLLKNGVPMLGALGVVNLSMENRVFRARVSSFQEKIRKGYSLSKCLREERIFPSILVNMVAVGEESGELTDMLARIAGTFETEVNRTAKSLISFLEPALILFIGGVVAFIVFSMLLPVFQLNLLAQ
ncbi:MAG TPA: type II secretion system F family protein [Candidatus Margulisiibacteriota bacterium]|nr:type II secretion system F family protein [Candidatus Margulisiibacteriota bacterium]